MFADQFGEQTYIRQGKAKGGLVGMTLSPDQVARWILSYHVCNTVSLAMDGMFQSEDEEYDAKTDRHKEEGQQRQKLDRADRMKIKQELDRHPHPLQQSETDGLFNIVNGHVANEKVNVHNALAIGEGMASEFKGLPGGFYSTIHSKVVTMETLKKGVKIGDQSIYDMEKLFGRLLVISQKRDVTLESMLRFELSPVPPALCDDYGCLRKSAKSQLLHKLAVWNASICESSVDVIDGNEMLYRITWPKTGTVRNLLQNFIRAVEREHDVIVVFDRYLAGSIKAHERLRRTGSTRCPTFRLTLETTPPTRDSVMKNVQNKKELIELFCDANDSQRVKMYGDSNSEYRHEEADCNIISHVEALLNQDYRHVQVVADDTDIFVLLVFFCWKWECTAQLSMRKSDGKIIDINATAKQLGPKSLQLVAVHALTGCDSTSYLFGKGNASAVAIMLKHDMNLEVFGQADANLCDVISAGHRFFSIMYTGKPSSTVMNQLRHTIFTSKRDTPKIKTLPPTDSALDEHIKRAHLQTML